jgi:protease-4
MGHRREYKTAMYLFTERGFNEPHRESYQSLLDSQVEQLVAGIAEGRGLDPAVVRELMDGGPFHASEAVDAGLVDRLSYRDEVYASLKDELRGTYLYADRYLKRAGRAHRKGATIALIHGTGSIARGRSKPKSLFGGASMGSDDVCAAIRKAVKAKRVKAILFRIDSPGGSAVASDAIWREVRRAREQGTPVVASMGNVAASGGYYVAMGADKIVADPGTITGSIGVVWGKFVTREAWKKLGVDWDSLQVGENADIWSPSHDLDEDGWKRLESFLDEIYDDFTGKVAESRGMDRDAVEAVAKGRVWTGTQAKENGLVDELGGFERALALTRAVAELPEGAPVKIRPFLPRRGLFARMRVEESSEAAAIGEAIRGLGVLPPIGPTALPPFDISTSPHLR